MNRYEVSKNNVTLKISINAAKIITRIEQN